MRAKIISKIAELKSYGVVSSPAIRHAEEFLAAGGFSAYSNQDFDILNGLTGELNEFTAPWGKRYSKESQCPQSCI